MAHECFADEIAIDFPSAGRVVERMRESFLGEPDGPARHDVFDAELLLSPREAFDGLVIPLCVPIRGACPACGGRGESFFHHTVSVAVPRGVADGTTFRFRVTSTHTGSVRVTIRIAIQPSLV